MCVVTQSRDRASLCNAVYIEWLSRLVKNFNNFGRCDGIPDTEPGKAVNFRERSEHNDVSLVANKSEHIGRIVKEFEIRLVKNNNDVLRHSRHEPVDRPLRDQCAGGIVWVWNENHPGF